MKLRTKLAIGLGIISIAGSAFAGSIRVYNNDSKTHYVTCGSKKMEIKASTTATYTFSSTSNSCKLKGGSVKFPVSELKSGQKWKIKNGTAKPM